MCAFGKLLWFRRRARREREIAEELAAHVEMRAEANRAAGMEAAAARRDAERRLGSDLALRERVRAADVPLWLEDPLRDARFAARALWRNRGLSVLAVATLALGIGAATAMFSVVNAVLLHPVPYPDAQRLVLVGVDSRVQGVISHAISVPAPAVAALERSPAFASRGAVTANLDQVVYASGLATPAWAWVATPRLFATLGVTPARGRLFSSAGGEALVSTTFAQRHLGGPAAAIGKPLRVGKASYTVVGVLPAGQGYPLDTGIWTAASPLPFTRNEAEFVARLPADVPLAEARARAAAALAIIGRRLAPRLGGKDFIRLTAQPLVTQRARPVERAELWVLFAAAFCLLLIACANSASLLLGRGLGRARELAVRHALGASRVRLARLLLMEGLWLALAGGAAGAALACLLVGLARAAPLNLPRLSGARINPLALGFACAVALACGLGCALAPALRFSHPRPPSRAQRLRAVLASGEVALTLVLLIGGLLLAASFQRMRHTGVGFRAGHLTAIGVAIQANDPAARNRTLADLLARVRALPGVEAATYSDHVPFGPESSMAINLPGAPASADMNVGLVFAGPGYLSTLGQRLLAGREFAAGDFDPARTAPRRCLISAALARALWPHRPPAAAVGGRLKEADIELAEIIGVTADTRDDGRNFTDGARPEIYEPFRGYRPRVQLLLRSPLPPEALVGELRALLPQVNPGLSLGQPDPIEAAKAASLAQPRFRALLLGLFAALAWALALIGLYGVLAFQVRQRRHEIGVRMALGAGNAAVLRLLLGQALAVLAAGIGAGWLLSWLLSRYIGSLLFGVGALDPATWLGAGAALLAAGLVASWLPARRALRVNPAETLRCE